MGVLLVTLLVVVARTPRPTESSASSTASRAVGEPAWPVPDGEATAVVEVLNGTGRAGLARTATRLLRSRGIDVVSYGNADSSAQSVILLRRGSQARARAVLHALGTGAIQVALDSTRHVDVTVILGSDFHPRMPLHP